MSTSAIAAKFDEWADAGRDASMESGHQDVVEQVVAQLGIGPGQQILDLGCGNGWATRLLAKSAAGSGAVGVDASPKMIKRAEELHSFTIRARYEVANFDALDFKDGHFDRAKKKRGARRNAATFSSTQNPTQDSTLASNPYWACGAWSASRALPIVKDAAFCRGGYSLKVTRNLPTISGSGYRLYA